jgi:hypothetical protein
MLPSPFGILARALTQTLTSRQFSTSLPVQKHCFACDTSSHHTNLWRRWCRHIERLSSSCSEPGHPSRLPRSGLSQGHAHAAHQPLPNLSYVSHHHSCSMNPSLPSNSTLPATASSCNFKVIFEKALTAYKNTTQQDRTVNPLFIQLQACDSPAAIQTILQDQVNQLIRSRSGDERLKNWLDPTINVLYAFSGTLGEGVGLVNVDPSVEGIALMPTR